MKPTDRLSIKLLGSYEDSDPKDLSLTSPSLGREKRVSDQPDRFTGKQTILNATIDYEFDFARLTSSSTYSRFNQQFFLDLAGTFQPGSFPGAPIAFGLDARARARQGVRAGDAAGVLAGGAAAIRGRGFLPPSPPRHRFLYRFEPRLPRSARLHRAAGPIYQKQYTYQVNEELAGFGELTYRSRRASG
ncbi:hypothetical protein AB5I41_18725 [Sphingomonas sp. MMS24-JH45]